MSARQRLRSLLLRPFRTRPAAPIRKAPRPVGRRIEELEDRVTPAFSEFIDPNPAAGNQFGLVVVPLSTGNVVVSAPGDDAGGTDAGAVYLFNGSTGALISTLTGSRANDRVGESVRALATGNFIVASSQWDNGAATDAGAVTFGSGTTGVSGVVSAANSLVGTTANDRVGFAALALATGNYVVFSKQWDNGAVVDAGAATFGNGTTGTVGAVSAANSLVGSRAGDSVGGGSGSTVLANGNYVVASPAWDNGSVVNAGAVTFGSGTTGVSGPITAANSLVGTQTNDLVGNSSIRELPNGNYLVVSTAWDNGGVADAGAVTFGSGTTGVSGTVSAANSLVGTHSFDFGGGALVTPLTNGNYVVGTSYWNSGAGAVTFGSGTTGVSGPVSAANSLVGNAGEEIGFGIVALTNGNYVVPNQVWDNGAATDAGAVAFGNGTTGITGTFTTANSLYGTTAGDQVGSDGVTALANGNYAVASPNWDRGATTNAGAVTWGNGSAGTTGPVTAANSLVGSTANDLVGLYTSGPAVAALTNGNYVVVSPRWQNGAAARAGAATLGNGSTGTAGPVAAANSLVGTTAFDQIGSDGVTPLANGNYVVRSHFWTNGAAAGAGAATFGSGTTGVTGPVTAANSLVGTTAADGVGDSTTFSGTPLSRVVALSNGNYVVVTARWDNGAVVDAGAATWGSGSTGVSGPISAANSLVGTTAGDFVYASVGVTEVGGGNYLVTTPGWDNGAAANVGAATWGSGTAGVRGAISAANSLVGTSANDALGYDVNGGVVTVFPNGNFLVRIPYWDNGALAEAGAVVFGGGAAGPSGPVAGANAVTGQAATTNLLAAVVDNANGAFYSRFLNEGGGRVRVGSQTTGFIAGTLTAVAAAGTLTVTDVAAQDNRITVSRSGGNLVIADAAQPFASAPAGGSLSNGNKTLTIPLASVSAVQFNLAGGNDRLTVDYSTGYFNLPIGYDGGAGGTDALAVKGDRGTFDTTSAAYGPDPTSTAANKKGAVRVTSGASTSYLTFSNLEPVDVSGMAVASLASLGAPATPLAADNDLTVAAGVANSTPGQAALVVTGTTNGGATPIEQVAFFNNTQVLIDTSGVAGSKDVVTVTGGTNAHGNVNVAVNTGAESGDAIRLNGALAASGAVNLTTGGPITDGNGTATADVKAPTVSLQAGTGIGTAGDLLEIDADTFTSVQTTSGGVNIDVWDSNNSTNTIGTVSAGSGNVVFFSTSGGGAASVNVFTGVLASNGTIDLSRNTDGALRVQALTASGTARVSAFGSTVSAIDHPSGAIVAGGQINLVADTMTLSGGTINAGANPVEFAPAANNRNVQIGAGAPTGGGVLGLSDVALGTVTSNQLIVGGFSLGGTVTVVGAVPLAGKTLYLGSSANAATPISDGTAGAGGAVIAAGSLGVFAASGGVDLSFNADTVAVNSSGPQYLQEADTVTVGSVSIGLPSVSGLSASSNTITLGGGTFALGASNQITDSTAVNVSGGALAVGTFSDTVAQLTLTSGSVTGTTGVLTSTATIQAMSGSASAALGGGNGLAKTTAGTVSLTSATSPYTGATTISGGTLSVTKVAAGGVPSSLGATAAATPIQISGGAVLEYAGTGDSTNRQITLGGGGGTVRSTTGPLTLTGAVNNGGNPLTLDATGGSIAVNSQVSGGGGLTKTGGGLATLNVANTYTGPTTVANGTLLVNGSVTSGVTVTSPGVLGGGGTIAGTVTGTGTVEPGTNGVGTLTVAGNFTPTGTVRFEVNAPYTAAGTDYDRLVVNGAANAVNLGGAAVAFASAGGGTPPAIPAGITLIQNNTSNPTTPFSNLAEGGLVALGAGGNARPFKISYAATDGNDAVLFDASPPTTVYVSTTFTGPVGQVLTDADFGTTGNQAAMVGYNAFATIAAALGVAAAGGTVVVNGGTYGETISLTGATATALRVTGPDAPQAVTITALSTSVGTTVTLQGASSLTVGDANPQTLAGLITGSGRLVKQGGGTLAVAGTNTYAGGTTLAGGSLDVRTDTALGSGTLTINGGTTLLSGSGLRTLAIPVVVAGSFAAGGTNGIHLGSGTASPVDLNGGSPTVTVTNGTMDLFLDGRVQNGALGATGAGRLALAQANTFAGGLTVGGTATVTFGTDTAAGTGTLTINGGTVAATGGTRTLANPVTVGGNFAVGSATLGQSLVLNGSVDLGGAARAVTVAAASPATFAGPLSNGGLGKAGAGTLILTGANTYAGATAVTDGTLQLDGSVTSNVTVTTPGVLIGTGTVTGNVDGTGTFSPGTAAGPGTMTVTGNFTPSGTVTFEVNAPFTTPGGTSDQYVVGGAVSLTGAAVTFANAIAGTPAAGQVVRLVNRTSAGTNTPAATPADGSFLTTAGLTTFRVFYNGGDGNDVTLVDSSAAPATVYVNDDWAALTSGTQLADADPAAAGNQPAIRGVSAFADVQPALDALPAGGGTVVVWGSGAVGVSANYSAFTVGKPAAFRLVADPNGESTVTVGGTISLNGQDFAASLDQGAGTANLAATGFVGSGAGPLVSITTTSPGTGTAAPGSVTGVGGVSVGTSGTRLNAVTLGSVSTGTGGVSVFANGPITLNGSVSTTAAAAAGPVAITGNVLLGGPVAISTDSTTDASITVTGTVNNAQPLTLAAGTGAVSLGGAVGGSTPLTSFTVTSAGAAALPAVTTAGNVGVTAGAITLSGDLRTDAGANAGAVALTGPVALASSVGIDTDAAGTDGDVSFSTSVSGTGRGLTVTAGGGDVAFGGNVGTPAARLADVTVASARNVTAAGIAASNTVRQLAGSGTTTLVGLLDVQPGGGPATGAVALTGTNFVVTGGVTAWSVVVTHTGANSLDVYGGDVTTLAAGPTGVYGFTAVAATAGTTGSVASRVTGPGNVTKQGPGTLTVSSGANNYTGTTTVDGGTLLVTGLVPGATAVNATGTLGGTGTVAGTVTVNNGGHVAPGVATGVLRTGSVAFAGGSAFDVQVNGTTPGTQADQLAVTGTVNLGGATLNASGTIPSVVGQVVTLIDVTGPSAAAGTFAGIPEGGTVLINGSNFAVSYVGGADGRDVTLTQLAFVGYVETGGGADFVLRRNQNGTPGNPADDLLQLLRNGVLVDTRPLSALSSYTLIGQNGATDTLLVDYAFGGVFATPVEFDGGTAAADRMTLSGATFTTAAFAYSNATDGTVTLDGATVTYTGLEALVSTLAAGTAAFTLPAGNDAATLSTPSAGVNRLASAPVTFVPTDFANPTGSLAVTAASGTDTVTVTGVAGGLTAAVSVTASGSVAVQGTGIATSGPVSLAFGQNGAGGTATIAAPVTGSSAAVTGGAGADTLIVTASGPTTLTLDGAGGGDAYQVSLGGLGGVVAVADTGASGTDAATVLGTAGNDAIEVNTTAARRLRLGEGGAPIVDYTASLESLTVDGAGGSDAVNVRFANGPLPGSFTVTDTGASGTDALDVFGTAGADSFDANTASAQAVRFGATGERATYTAAVEQLTVNGPADPVEATPQAPAAADAADSFTVTPDAATTITVNGGRPTSGAGDALDLRTGGLTGPVSITDPTGTPGTSAVPHGRLTSGNRRPVLWNSVETLPTPLGLGGAFDFQPAGSPAQPGFNAVTPADLATGGAYSAFQVGWVDPGAGAFDRVAVYGASGNPNSPAFQSLLRDGEWGWYGGGANNGLFQVAVAPGSTADRQVQVTVLAGDTYAGRDTMNVYVRNTATGARTRLNPTPATFNTVGQPYQFVSYSGVIDPGASPTPGSPSVLLQVEFEATAGGSSTFWTVEGVDVRPVGLVAPLTLTRAGGNAAVPGDGTTVDTYTGSGAAPGAELTVGPQLGTAVGTDADPAVKGFQVIADGSGNFTVAVRRPTGPGSSVISVADVTGASGTGLVGPTAASPTPYQLPNPYTQTFTAVPPPPASPTPPPAAAYAAFDFNSGASPTLAGFQAVQPTDSYSPALGRGWQSAVGGYDRGAGGTPAALFQDGAYGYGSPGTFQVSVPNGAYDVRVYVGDPYNPWAGVTVTAGVQTVTVDAANRFGYVTLYGVPVTGGVLSVSIGTSVNSYWVAAGLEAATAGTLPAPATPAAAALSGGRRLDFNGASADTLAGFTAATGAAYSPAAGYGWVNGAQTFERAASPVPAGLTAAQWQLFRDAAWGQGTGVFAFAVPAGGANTFAARTYVGDSYSNWPGITLQMEGGPVVAADTAAHPFWSYPLTGRDANGDGVVTVTVTGQVWVVNGFDLVQTGGTSTGSLPGSAAPAPAPQLAAGGAAGGRAAGLTADQLAPVAAEAVRRWEAAGLSAEQVAALRGVRFEFADLNGVGRLGEASLYGNLVALDDDGAGRGWFVDATPGDDAEFGATRPAGYDLLTVVMHELGHVVGLDSLEPAGMPNDLMTATLDVGVRRQPGARPVALWLADAPTALAGSWDAPVVTRATAAEPVAIPPASLGAMGLAPDRPRPGATPAWVPDDDLLLSGIAVG